MAKVVRLHRRSRPPPRVWDVRLWHDSDARDGRRARQLFSHLSEERQIQNFLYAFQQLWQPRTRATARRDSGLRATAADDGKNVLEGLVGEISRL
ncbi:hypothetical protein LXA43DRAFT_1101023 [Ganoderma leucocontextum]|nr:hypothetical protein LXA43DRAFT_1101023 [Ganoderma leucocontextum]